MLFGDSGPQMKSDISILKWKMNSWFLKKRLLLALNSATSPLILNYLDLGQLSTNNCKKSTIFLKVKTFKSSKEFSLKKEKNKVLQIWIKQLQRRDQLSLNLELDKRLKILLLKIIWWKLALQMFMTLKILSICWMMQKKKIQNNWKMNQNLTFQTFRWTSKN